MSALVAPWWMMHDHSNNNIALSKLPIFIAMEYDIQPEKHMCSKPPDSFIESFESGALFTWLDKRMAFRCETYSAISMVERLQVPQDNFQISEIRILCANDIEESVSVFEDMVVARINCDPDDLFELCETEKSKWTVDIIKKVCELISVHINIDLQSVLVACEKTQDLDYMNEWIWGERPSPNNECLARVVVKQDISKTSITANIYDESGLVFQKILVEDSPYLPDLWKRYLYDLKWLSNTKVGLYTDDDLIEVELS